MKSRNFFCCRFSESWFWNLYIRFIALTGGTTLKSKAGKSEKPKTHPHEKSFPKFLLLIIEYGNERTQKRMRWLHSTNGLLTQGASICAQPQKPWKTAVFAIFSSLAPATTTGWSRSNPAHIILIDYMYVWTSANLFRALHKLCRVRFASEYADFRVF